MGIQINGQTDTISATDGSLNIAGTVAVQVTGDATGLTGTPNITVGVVTASSAVISGDLTVNGTTTTLDTTLTEVDKLEVGANNTTVGVAITQSGSGDILRLYDGASQVVTVKDGGNVGIGTTNPSGYNNAARNLVIEGGTQTGLTIATNSLTGNSRIYFADSTGGSGDRVGQINYQHTDDVMFFVVNGSERLRIDSSGNVGIGLTNPSTKLHLSSGTATQITISNTSSSMSDGDTMGTLDFAAGPSHTVNARVAGAVEGTSEAGGDLVFETRADGGSLTERLRITSSGRFLYGTGSSGGYALFDNATTNPKFQFRQTSGEPRGAAFIEDRADAFGFDIYISKSRGSGTSVLSNGDQLGKIWFTGADGTNQVAGAGIIASVSGTPGNDNMPTALLFETNSGTSGTTERMRINNVGGLKLKSNGAALVSSTTNAAHEIATDNNGLEALYVTNRNSTSPVGVQIYYSTDINNTANYFLTCYGTSNLRAGFRSNGGLANYQSNNVNLCDEREKKNIVNLDSTWDCLKHWELKKFHYNEDADDADLRYGVIAQQVAPHCPEVISDWVKQQSKEEVLDEDGNVVTPAQEEIVRMAVKEQQMMWMAIKALQEAQTRIETLETRLTALEGAQSYSLQGGQPTLTGCTHFSPLFKEKHF